VNWLLSAEVLDFLASVDTEAIAEDFSYAYPQLVAIRNSFAKSAV